MPEINFNDYFYYDETSPSCLRWKVDRWAGKDHNIPIVCANDVAGGVCKDYYRVYLNYVKLSVHRVIWELFNGKIPDKANIDHFDRNKLNNNITNLRCVSEAVNSRNCLMWKTNKSGVTGVSFRSGKYPAWRAGWVDIEGTKKDKHFSCTKYGHELAFKLACDYRKKMIEDLNALGLGYADQHGI